MSFWGTLLETLKSFWRLARSRVAEFFPRWPSVPKTQPASTVDIEATREHARAAWTELVRKRAPHLLAQGRFHPLAGPAFPTGLRPATVSAVKSAMLPRQPKPFAPVPAQVLMGRTILSSKRSREISGAARQDLFPVGRGEGAPVPRLQRSAPQVLPPRYGIATPVSLLDGRKDADRFGHPVRLNLAASGSVSGGEPMAGYEAASPNAVASGQGSESFYASEITPSFQRDVEMTAVPGSPNAELSWKDAPEGEAPFAAPSEEAMAERAVAPLPASPGWPGEASRPEIFDPGLGHAALGHAALEMDAWSEPFADSPRPRFSGAGEASNLFVATPGEERPSGSLRQASGPSDRWPSLLPDRQPETDSRLPVFWREMAYRQRLVEEQRGL